MTLLIGKAQQPENFNQIHGVSPISSSRRRMYYPPSTGTGQQPKTTAPAYPSPPTIIAMPYPPHSRGGSFPLTSTARTQYYYSPRLLSSHVTHDTRRQKKACNSGHPGKLLVECCLSVSGRQRSRERRECAGPSAAAATATAIFILVLVRVGHGVPRFFIPHALL